MSESYSVLARLCLSFIHAARVRNIEFSLYHRAKTWSMFKKGQARVLFTCWVEDHVCTQLGASLGKWTRHFYRNQTFFRKAAETSSPPSHITLPLLLFCRSKKHNHQFRSEVVVRSSIHPSAWRNFKMRLCIIIAGNIGTSYNFCLGISSITPRICRPCLGKHASYP